MIILINTDEIKKLDLSINEVMCLYTIKYNNLDYKSNFHYYKSLENKGFIKIINKNSNPSYILRIKGDKLITSLINNQDYIEELKSKNISKRTIDSIITIENINKYRNLWKGLQVGSMGSPKSCKDKLSRWVKENPGYSFDDILKAAKLYINSLSDYKYLQRADYFIFKKEGKEESSRLSAFIEEIDTILVDNDWTSNLN